MVDVPGSHSPTHGLTHRPLVELIAGGAGAVFVLVGLLGFVPGITTNFDTLTFAGHHSDAKLLGIFEVSVLHNIVHLLFGLVGLVMMRTVQQARTYLIGGGAIYLALWLYGLIIDQNSGANFVPLNTPDNWLHFVLGAGMIAAGVLTGTRGVTARR